MIYLDWAASAPPEPEILDLMRDCASRFYANPSSPHAAGRDARDELERSRETLARIFGGGRIVFTSGATESNGVCLLSLLRRQRTREERGKPIRVVISAIEHASIHEQVQALAGFGISSTLVPPDADGMVSADKIGESLDADTVLVSVMAVNNETGAIQDVKRITDVVRSFSRGRRRILVHSDAAQAFGKIPFRPMELGIDAASISGHKIGGPRGVGALWLSDDASLEPLAAGGGQEGRKRPGTENLPGICGIVNAAEKRISDLEEARGEAQKKIDVLIEGLQHVPGICFFPETRGTRKIQPSFSPHILCLGFPPIPGEVLVRIAESRGFLIATGSACASRKKSRTRILEAMGIPSARAFSAVRISIGPGTTAGELGSFIMAMREEVPAALALAKKTR
jgi:cysteine desulfurase